MEVCNNQLNVADKLLQGFNLSIIPVGSTKTPFAPWKQYQTSTAPFENWYKHYQNQFTVGIIAGKVSGNLECIDIDVKNDPLKTIYEEYCGLIPKDLLNRLIIQSTPNFGYHFIYKCPDVVIESNQKLALHSNGEVIIETRGEGGYFCTNRLNNQILQGQFDLSKPSEIVIPVITPEEREFLLEVARSLTRFFPMVKSTSSTDNTKGSSKNVKSFSYSEPAINEFNDKYCIIDLFISHDWSIVNEDDEKFYLKRNGSLAPHSAYYFKDSKVFYCFSTSTEFKAEQPYNHFQVLQLLEGKNDYRTTLRLLPSLGFELKINTKGEISDKVTADDIANCLNDQNVRFDSFIQDLTINGKIIEEMEYNTLFINLKKHFNKEIARGKFEEVIKSDYITKFNPIEEFINKTESLTLCGSFSTALDGINYLKQQENVDLIFLDIEMPEMSGIDFMEALKNLPQIIIISSKGKYAIDAFEYDVTDYLLKPVAYARFYKAVDKVMNRQKQTNLNSNSKDEIFIKKNSSLVRLKYDDILWVEALENYVIFNTFSEKYTIHFTMKAVEVKLPTNKFVRVHRSFIVNTSSISEIDDNTIIVKTVDGNKSIPIGKSYRDKLMNDLNLIVK